MGREAVRKARSPSSSGAESGGQSCLADPDAAALRAQPVPGAPDAPAQGGAGVLTITVRAGLESEHSAQGIAQPVPAQRDPAKGGAGVCTFTVRAVMEAEQGAQGKGAGGGSLGAAYTEADAGTAFIPVVSGIVGRGGEFSGRFGGSQAPPSAPLGPVRRVGHHLDRAGGNGATAVATRCAQQGTTEHGEHSLLCGLPDQGELEVKLRCRGPDFPLATLSQQLGNGCGT